MCVGHTTGVADSHLSPKRRFNPYRPRSGRFTTRRARILELTGQSKFSYGYFSQTMLPSYERINPEETAA